MCKFEGLIPHTFLHREHKMKYVCGRDSLRLPLEREQALKQTNWDQQDA